jgi:hypothetical protein
MGRMDHRSADDEDEELERFFDLWGMTSAECEYFSRVVYWSTAIMLGSVIAIAGLCLLNSK